MNVTNILPFKLYKVRGHSMEPTIKAGSFVLVWCWTKNYQVDDVVAFHHDNKIFIKRIKTKKEAAYEVAGDNAADSSDVGLINRSTIIGKVIST